MAPKGLFGVGVALVAFLLHRVEGNWWWLGPCLALATAAVTGRLLGLYQRLPNPRLTISCGLHHIGCPTRGTHCPTSGLALTPRPTIV